MLPNRLRGVPRVNDFGVVNDIFATSPWTCPPDSELVIACRQRVEFEIYFGKQVEVLAAIQEDSRATEENFNVENVESLVDGFCIVAALHSMRGRAADRCVCL
jgi:hypothetical protein